MHATALVQERVIALKGSPFGQLHRNVPGAFWHCASLPHEVRSRHSSMSEIINYHVKFNKENEPFLCAFLSSRYKYKFMSNLEYRL